MSSGRRVTVIIEEFGGAEAGEPGCWVITCSSSSDLQITSNGVKRECTMAELDALAQDSMAEALRNYRGERRRGRKRHGNEVLP